MRSKDIYDVLIPAKSGGESNIIVHVCLSKLDARDYFAIDKRDCKEYNQSNLRYYSKGLEHWYVSMDDLTRLKGCRIRDFIIEV